jgi:hypothetical protein
MEQSPPQELQKLFTLYTSVIRPRIEETHKKKGINLTENIISESINSKDGGKDGSGTDVNNK